MRKSHLIILIMVFLSFLSVSVRAVAITDCSAINSSGSYVLQNDISCNAPADCRVDACILINSSNVDLDLGGYKIEDDGCNCGYGIKNYGATQTNIEVFNGKVREFHNAQIGIVQVTTGDYYDLNLTSPSGGDGIRMINPLHNNIQIRDNWIETQDYGVFGVCFTSGCSVKIVNNVIRSFDGIKLQGNGFIVEKNSIGEYTGDNSGSSTPCTRSEAYVDHSIVCDYCEDTKIRDNIILSDEGIIMNGISHDTLVQFNDFFMNSIGDVVPTEFGSSSYNNTFCGNRVCEVYLNIVDGICWWERICEEGASHVDDNGVGNSIMNDCVDDCVPSYYCDDDDKVFIDSSCSILERFYCEYGCEDGSCYGEESETPFIPATTTTLPSITETYNISWTTPILNVTEAQQAGLGWVVPFFSPFFLAHILMFIVAGGVAMFSRAPLMGGLVSVVFFVIYAFMGMYPVWIVIIMVVLAVGVVAMFGKRLVS